jgi:hypothetical protein
MKRRMVLQSIAAFVAVRPFTRLRLFAQNSLSEADIATLKAIAEVTLPASAGAAGRDKAVEQFVRWVRNYKEGADRGHGYGNSQLSPPAGPSPAARYPAQFAALDKAAADEGASSFAKLPVAARRAIVESALNTPQPVTRLPARPTGANLVADFMGLYFNSAEAVDLCYRAAIERDTCRGLDNSEQAPRPLGGQ